MRGEIGTANDGYVMDPSLAPWGYFLTWNSVMFTSSGGNPSFLINDSDHDYNGNDGRLVMHFDPLCIPTIYNFHGMWEFIEIPACDNVGDLNGDSLYNVLDIVALVDCILSGNCEDEPNACAADANSDENYNVLDVVYLVSCILENNCDDI